MIDPTKITNFHLNDGQLEEMVCFWILVAGKNAKTTAKLLDGLLSKFNNLSPFDIIKRYYGDGYLGELLKECGFGCYNIKSRALGELAFSDINLRTCSAEELEKIYGIGMKTSRCFIMHTRENARYAGLDTHCLKWLKSLGYDAPKSTPSRKKYLELEKIFVGLADKFNKPVAVLDLEIWVKYSSKVWL